MSQPGNQPQPRPGPLAGMWGVFQDICATLAIIFSLICLVALAYFLNTWHILGFWESIMNLIISVIFLGAAWFFTSLAKYLG